jgi:hypothetical protein
MKNANELVLDGGAVSFITREQVRPAARREWLKNDLVADALGFLIAFATMASSWLYVAATSRP